ncbi:MAG: hypothetical protein JST01_07690 [Cyanobacteria bacterium SZAS TMP-1]|nr:hypothetical protein [Cyanobacteria bacterium SZAS TMP-1]
MSKTKNGRSKNGVLATVLLAISVVTACCLSSLGMDIAHGALVHSQLQTAVDSGALAGAYELEDASPTADALKTAGNSASVITAANLADGQAVSNSTPGTVVKVDVVSNAYTRSVTVTATRSVAPIFARLFGGFSAPVSARAVATVSKGLSEVNSNQVYNLAVSLDCIPSSGVQAGLPLDSYTGDCAPNKPFTIVLNPQKSKNSGWVKDWTDSSSPALTIGSTQVNMSNGVMGSKVAAMSVGQSIVVPIIQGDPPYNKTNTVVGIVGLKITSIDFPNTITGYLTTPICNGKPNMPFLATTSSADNLFLSQWAPATVRLSQ